MSGASEVEWVSWDVAARIVGCPVPTIEWYLRLGHIERRPRRGRRPTLSRASVERFAAEHQARLQERERRREAARQRRRERPRRRRRRQAPKTPAHPGPGWIRTAEAADQLGCTQATVQRLCRTGELEATYARGRYWVTQESTTRAREARNERDQWIGYQHAARLIGCPSPVVRRAADEGLITTREAPRRVPRLLRASVEHFATHHWPRILDERQAARAQREREREREHAKEQRPRPDGPPDEDHVWLDTATTALVLGCSPSSVRARAARDRIPHTRHRGRWWFRRDHIEQLAAAQAHQRQLAGDAR